MLMTAERVLCLGSQFGWNVFGRFVGLLSRSCCEGGGGLRRVGVVDHGVELRSRGSRPGLPGGQGGDSAVHVDVVRGQRITAVFGPQRPVRSDGVVTLPERLQPLSRFGRALVEMPVDLFGLEGLVEALEHPAYTVA